MSRKPRGAGDGGGDTREGGPRSAGRKVVPSSGDGGFGQYVGEPNTAVLHGMNISHVPLNNGELVKISREQRAGNRKSGRPA